jgi:Tfp pilus assembly protein FimV
VFDSGLTPNGCSNTIASVRRTRVRRRRLAFILAATLAVVSGLQGLAGEAGAGVGSTAPGDRPGARTYTVRPGDTVWRIAVRFAGPGADPRPLVDAIVQANGIDPGAIIAGQTLNIPPG